MSGRGDDRIEGALPPLHGEEWYAGWRVGFERGMTAMRAMVDDGVVAAARREGVIEGLERALELMLGEGGWRPSTIRAEIERLRNES